MDTPKLRQRCNHFPSEKGPETWLEVMSLPVLDMCWTVRQSCSFPLIINLHEATLNISQSYMEDLLLLAIDSFMYF